jgi:hypothetical protein
MCQRPDLAVRICLDIRRAPVDTTISAALLLRSRSGSSGMNGRDSGRMRRICPSDAFGGCAWPLSADTTVGVII